MLGNLQPLKCFETTLSSLRERSTQAKITQHIARKTHPTVYVSLSHFTSTCSEFNYAVAGTSVFAGTKDNISS